MSNIREIAQPFTPRALRVSPVIGDSMAPTMQPGDFVFAVPTAAYEGEGYYILEGDDIYRVQSAGRRGLLLSKDNPRHTRYDVPRDWFANNVVAYVVGIIKVLDGRYFQRNNIAGAV